MENNVKIIELNKLILDLSKDVNSLNHKKILEFYQENNFYNNSLIERIIGEEIKEIKIQLIDNNKNNNIVDYKYLDYFPQLFSIFKSNYNYYIEESKVIQCLLC